MDRRSRFSSNDVPDSLQYDADSDIDVELGEDDAEIEEMLYDMQHVFDDSSSDSQDEVQVAPKRRRMESQESDAFSKRLLSDDYPNMDPVETHLHIKTELDTEFQGILVEDPQVKDAFDPLQPTKTEVEEQFVEKPAEMHPGTGTDERIKCKLSSRCTLATDRGSTSSDDVNNSAMYEENEWTYLSRKIPLENPVFASQHGLRTSININSTPYECLSQFFTPDFWNLLITETNRYADQMIAKQSERGPLKEGSSLSRWKPVTLPELKQFFSIIIHMTLVQKHNFDGYWSTTPILHSPFATQIMRRDRFRSIFSSLHLNNNSNFVASGSEGYDPFFKLRPYLEELGRVCQAHYLPNENLIITEETCGFRNDGHYSKVLNQEGATYGMKIYMLSDAETGYVLTMAPCVGGSKAAEDSVMSLVEPYLEKWHTVYMSKSFTNPATFDLLWDHKTRAVGPVASNRRDLPEMLRQHPLKMNGMIFCHRGNLTVCKWRVKQDIMFLSTKHAASRTEVKLKGKGAIVKKIKPDCVIDYAINKSAIDLNAQYVAYCTVRRKSMKWWKKMFFHLIARAIVNSYIIFNHLRPVRKRREFHKFLCDCGEAMAREAGAVCGKPCSGPQPTGSTMRLTGRHFPERIPASDKKDVRARVCKVCADTIKKATGTRGRKETTYYCPDCNVPLCVNSCFKKYHTMLDYTA